MVVDGELVMLVDGRLSFDALQRRLVTALIYDGECSPPSCPMAADPVRPAWAGRTQPWVACGRDPFYLAGWA